MMIALGLNFVRLIWWSNICLVHGALRCLAFLSGDLDDTIVPKLVPILFPSLHTIVSSPQVSLCCLVLLLFFAGVKPVYAVAPFIYLSHNVLFGIDIPKN